MRRRESPIKRVNPSGEVVWVARYTGRDGRRRIAKPTWNDGKGTFDRKHEAQRAIDEAYERSDRPDTVGQIFETWPDIEFTTRRLYVRDGLVVQEWTATATHRATMRRGDLVAEPSGRRVTWDGLDVIPFEGGLVKRKDVYSDSVAILRQVGLLD